MAMPPRDKGFVAPTYLRAKNRRQEKEFGILVAKCEPITRLDTKPFKWVMGLQAS
jgi:hypothetical protein